MGKQEGKTLCRRAGRKKRKKKRNSVDSLAEKPRRESLAENRKIHGDH